MLTVSLFLRLEAKPGKEAELAAFLMQGLELARQEATTPVWFALRIGPSTFGIFDAFADEAGRRAHLNGPIAQALMAQAPNLLASPPVIERVEVLGAKLPQSA
jgi:quinol monooxygenase YgiN